MKKIEKDSVRYGEYQHDGVTYIGMSDAYPTNLLPTWESEDYEIQLWGIPAYNRETLQEVTLTLEVLLDKAKLEDAPEYWGDPSNWPWDDFEVVEATTERD